MASQVAAQTTTKIREGHAVIIKDVTTRPTLSSATQKCGQGETNQCFGIWPDFNNIVFQNSQGEVNLDEQTRARAIESIRNLNIVEIEAAMDNCKNDAGIQLTVGSTTYEFEDDDYFAGSNCDGTMTKYNSNYRHGSDCRANEEAVGEACIVKCSPTQIWRPAGWIVPIAGTRTTSSVCETKP